MSILGVVHWPTYQISVNMVSMSASMATERTRYIVGARRIPPKDRDIAQSVLSDPDTGYEDVIGSDESVLLGRNVTYVAHLTPEQAGRYRAADNLRYLEEDVEATADVYVVEPAEDEPQATSAATDATAATAGIPEPDVVKWLRADVPGLDGREVTIAVLDGGIPPAVRAKMGNEFVATRNFTDVEVGDDGYTTDHGALVAPVCVPTGSKVMDAIIGTNEGRSQSSWFAAAVRWAVDGGAEIINYSYSGANFSSAHRDAIVYARDRSAVIFASAGNRGLSDTIDYPAALSREYPAMVSSSAHDHRTDMVASFSNRHADMSGCAPGKSVLTLGPDGLPRRRVSGTSFSSPLMAWCAALLLSDGKYSAAQVVEALRNTARDTLSPKHEEGRGGWNVTAALAMLSKSMPTPQPDPVSPPPAPTEPVPTLPKPMPWWRAHLPTRARRWIQAARAMIAWNRRG